MMEAIAGNPTLALIALGVLSLIVKELVSAYKKSRNKDEDTTAKSFEELKAGMVSLSAGFQGLDKKLDALVITITKDKEAFDLRLASVDEELKLLRRWKHFQSNKMIAIVGNYELILATLESLAAKGLVMMPKLKPIPEEPEPEES